MANDGDIELEVLPDALAVIDGWLGIKQHDEIVSTELPVQRPARLGLGAKFLPHKLVQQNQSDKLEKSIKKSLKRHHDNDDDEDDQPKLDKSDSEDSDSEGFKRAGGSSKKARIKVGANALEILTQNDSKKKNKKKKKKGEAVDSDNTKNATDKHTIDNNNKAGKHEQSLQKQQENSSNHIVQQQSDAVEAKVQHIDNDNDSIEADGVLGWGTWGEPHAGDSFAQENWAKVDEHFGGVKPKQHIPAEKSQASQMPNSHKPGQVQPQHSIKKKVRSKQKNIKKDNRPLDKRPSHLQSTVNKT